MHHFSKPRQMPGLIPVTLLTALLAGAVLRPSGTARADYGRPDDGGVGLGVKVQRGVETMS